MPLTILSVTAHSELEQAELERDAIKHGGGQCGIAADGLVGEPAITSHRKPPDLCDSRTSFHFLERRFRCVVELAAPVGDASSTTRR
ncbi:hypothetical protein [Burkholderia multivorans]|uniref:hypothetical protein n=2 Tax=Burkholderia multivorans TaxID=87883 RepID=UPI001C26B40E|nr:hypothetical protein [Burkholderia multivorans]MBU9485612.1 hypothetical protein [Burkholderia multivorans]